MDISDGDMYEYTSIHKSTAIDCLAAETAEAPLSNVEFACLVVHCESVAEQMITIQCILFTLSLRSDIYGHLNTPKVE